MNAAEAEGPLPGLRRLRKILGRTLKRKRVTLEKQRAELAEALRAEWYRQIADSLLANPSPPKGSDNITIFNIHTQNEEPVTLNPALDCRENAALFYKKARKGLRGREISLRKIVETETEVRIAELLLSEADAALVAGSDDGTLIALCGRIASALRLPASDGTSRLHAVQKTGERVHFRRCTIDGWDIFIGRNDSQNDELTTRFARPHDLWLHVAGHAGSHVLVCRPDRTIQVPLHIIKMAASLAVWFSKAKHASFAEVHYAEARFVRKRRRAPPGEVTLERYKSVRVSPRQPEDFFPSRYDKRTE